MITKNSHPRTFLKLCLQHFVFIIFICIFGFAHAQNLDSLIRIEIQNDKPHIPGVVGFGQNTKGGHGGAILRVTNLNADGKGSLADALNTEGPRIVVFEVGGIIDLGGKSLTILNPYITIAGQTAPYPGVTLIRGGLRINTHEVIVQHIKVRPGEAGQPKKSGWEVDGIATSQGAHHVIIDHCSVTWATDENISASGPRFEGADVEEWRQNTSHRVTISHCIIASGLSHSTHAKGEHSKGTLIHDNATQILVYGNLYANNMDRNPYCKGGSQSVVANNYVYNPGRGVINYGLVAHEWEDQEPVTGAMSVVGNYIEYGPDSRDGLAAFRNRGGDLRVYWKDNTIDSFDSAGPLIEGRSTFLSEPHVWPDGLNPRSSHDTKQWVLRNAGAFYWNRDTVDQAIINDICSGKGMIIDSEQEAGGYPMEDPVHRKLTPAVFKK